jgi:hypothetical protein
MKTKNQIIEKLYKENFIQSVIKKYTTKLSFEDEEDVSQEIYLILLEMPEEEIVQLFNNNQLNFYIVKIIKNQLLSITSMVYKLYLKNKINTVSLNEEINKNTEEYDN